MAKPENNGRKPDGTFAPGNNVGANGRPVGSLNKTTLAVRKLLEGQHKELTEAAIRKALEGDGPALKLCLDRIAPPPKDAPVSFDMPSVKTIEDAVQASEALLTALAAGEVTPDEAGRVMALLTAHKSLVETADIEARIRALEVRNGK